MTEPTPDPNSEAPDPTPGLPIVLGADQGVTYVSTCTLCEQHTTFTVWHGARPPEDLRCVYCGSLLVYWALYEPATEG